VVSELLHGRRDFNARQAKAKAMAMAMAMADILTFQ
jgi:hypothetical protein